MFLPFFINPYFLNYFNWKVIAKGFLAGVGAAVVGYFVQGACKQLFYLFEGLPFKVEVLLRLTSSGLCVVGSFLFVLCLVYRKNPKDPDFKTLEKEEFWREHYPDSKEYIPRNKPKSKLKDWQYQKGAKRLERVSRSGHKYIFSEGRLTFPDPLDRPSRTIITGEGGLSPSRFKHVVEQEGVLRRLTPIELERLNMFPDDHTKLQGIRDAKRAFFMGNALVVGVVERLGKELGKRV